MKFRTALIVRRISAFLLTLVTLAGICLSPVAATEGSAPYHAITEDNYVKLATALNAATHATPYQMGANAGIFNHTAEEFRALFTATYLPELESHSVSGSSIAEVATQYDSAYGIGGQLADALSIPVGTTSKEIGSRFDTTVGDSLSERREEYFEYYELYKHTVVAKADWLTKDLSAAFSDSFVKEYGAIADAEDAVDLLKKYGTHVFDRYYFGGALILTKYAASEGDPKAAYESAGKTLSLSANVGDATELMASGTGESFRLSDHTLNTDTTKSQLTVKSYGGSYMNAATADALFSYNQEYAANGSGYLYKAWLNSLDARNAEVVVRAEGAVAIWELLKNSQYYNADKEALLKEAFDLLCRESFDPNGDGASDDSEQDGSAEHPYRISSAAQWDDFFTNPSTYYGAHVTLTADIDLGGKIYEVGGSDSKTPFSGRLNGNGHTISNATVIAQSDWGGIGLFGVNNGTIENLVLDNVRCMNSGILTPGREALAAGILVGRNNGAITNIQLKNSSIRIAARITESPHSATVGALVGYHAGSLTDATVSDCHVSIPIWDSQKGNVSCGGMVGHSYDGVLETCLVRDSVIRSDDDTQTKNTLKKRLGGVIGSIQNLADKHLRFCLVYDTVIEHIDNETLSSVGYMAGYSNRSGLFFNCYYEAQEELSVDGEAMTGCTPLKSLTLKEIGNDAWTAYWTSDEKNGKPILKCHQ